MFQMNVLINCVLFTELFVCACLSLSLSLGGLCLDGLVMVKIKHCNTDWQYLLYTHVYASNSLLKMKCCMHVARNAKSPLTPFSHTSWAKFVQCALSWENLHTTESVVAENAIAAYNLRDDIQDVPANVGYHRECYMLFTNKEHIARALKRREKDSEGLY